MRDIEYKVEGHESLVKRGAVVSNTNREEFLLFLARREHAKAALDERDAMRKQIDDLTKQVEMLVSLVARSNTTEGMQ